MRIALITIEFPPVIIGGAGVLFHRSAIEITNRKHEVHVFTLGNDHHYRYELDGRIHIHRMPIIRYSMLKTISYWAFTPFALRWISHKFGDFDIVHSNGISDLTLSKYISSKPRVVTAHHLARSHVEVVKPSRKHRLTHPGDELGLVPYLESVSYRRADCIVAVSEHTKSELISKLGIEPKKIKVIRHGANRGDYLFPLEELTLIRNEIGVGTPHMLLCVGRLEPRKGIDTLLSSFALIKQVTNATLVIVGSGSQIILRNLAKNLDIEDRVIFLGYVDDIKLRKLFAACDLFILPSLLEGLGIVALEARAAGKFVVASDVGGIPEAVPPSSGILVPPGEVNQLAEAIKTGLNNQYDNFPPVRSWNETGAELCAFYEEVFQDSTKLSTSK